MTGRDWQNRRRSNGRAWGTRPMSRCCAMERCGPRSRTLSFHMSMLAMLAQPVKSQPIRNWEPGGLRLSFLAAAAMHEEHKIHEMMGRAMAAVIMRNEHELRVIF